MLMKLKMTKKLAFVLCVCILLVTCLSMPTMAATRYGSLAWSTASVKDKDTITGFAGQPMLYAYAMKSGSGNNITATGYAENICIDEYSVTITEYFVCSYNGDSSEYPINKTASTTVGKTPLSASVSYSDFAGQNSAMLALYTVHMDRSHGGMTIKSTCPYPYNMYYVDIYTLPSLAS